MRGNIIRMKLEKGKVNTTDELYQYDYGQKLIFEDVDLPQAYEVHFSNGNKNNSKTMIGDETGVAIPDEFLTTGKPVFVWLYLHNSANDGETEYDGRISVIARSKPTTEEPTPVQQGVIEQAIAALEVAVTTTGEAVETATEAAGRAENAQEAAETAQRASEDARDRAEHAAYDVNSLTVRVNKNERDIADLNESMAGKISTSQKGASNGVAELDSTGKVPSSQLPSFVDDVVEYNTFNDFPIDGEAGKIYIDKSTNKTYRWGGSEYVVIASDLALGETSSTAYRGDRGAAAYTHGVTNKGIAVESGFKKLTTNSEGHVTAETPVLKSDVTGLGIAPTDSPVFTGSISMGRVIGSTVGYNSSAVGSDVIASGSHSHAEGSGTTASGYESHAEGASTSASGACSHAEGAGTVASGSYAHAEGASTTASNYYSHAEGAGSRSIGSSSHAEGNSTYAAADNAHAEGYQTQAVSSSTHAEGYQSIAANNYAHAEGYLSTASGQTSHSEGYKTQAFGYCSHAEGQRSNSSTTTTYDNNTYSFGASGNTSHSEGEDTIAYGVCSHAEGQKTKALANYAHTEGYECVVKPNCFAAHAEGHGNIAQGSYSHVEGLHTVANSTAAHAEGMDSYASGQYSHAEGCGGTYTLNGTTITSMARGACDHVEGYQCQTVSGTQGNHAEGYQTSATGGAAHAENYRTIASGYCSHAEGQDTTAAAAFSHAEGQASTISSNAAGAHAEGYNNTVSSAYAHAEGMNNSATQTSAHAEGASNEASNYCAHAEGNATKAKGVSSHAEGYCTVANGGYSHVCGKYNVEDSYESWPEWESGTEYAVGDKVKRTTTSSDVTTIRGYYCKTANSDVSFTSSKWTQDSNINFVEIIGNGTYDSANGENRSNARAVDWDGNEYLKGTLYVNCNADSTGGTPVITQHQDISGKLNVSEKGAANGVAELDENGKVPVAQLPSYVDDVEEYDDFESFPAIGESGKIYVAKDVNLTYRWGGSEYVAIASDLALGETSSTAYRGDRGAAAYAHAVTNKGSQFYSGLYKITTNSEGHVTAAELVVKQDIVDLGIPSQDTTYEIATTEEAQAIIDEYGVSA